MRSFIKFNNQRIKGFQRTESHGRSFHSKLEAAHYGNLLLLEQAGEISNIRCQVHVKLTLAEIVSIVDFVIFDPKRGMDIYHEVKGFETPEWRIKRRLWEYYGPGPLEIYSGRYSNIRLKETLIPKT